MEDDTILLYDHLDFWLFTITPFILTMICSMLFILSKITVFEFILFTNDGPESPGL